MNAIMVEPNMHKGNKVKQPVLKHNIETNEKKRKSKDEMNTECRDETVLSIISESGTCPDDVKSLFIVYCTILPRCCLSVLNSKI